MHGSAEWDERQANRTGERVRLCSLAQLCILSSGLYGYWSVTIVTNEAQEVAYMIMVMVCRISNGYTEAATALSAPPGRQASYPSVPEDYVVLNLHELNVFVEAALAQNFSVAARRLFLSQPAVSLHIGNLERQLGTELFRRNGRSIQLSEAGRILLPLAQESLRQVKNIEETMSGLKGVLIGELVIACSTTVGKYILPRLVAGFRRRYPEVRVVVNVMARRAAIESLLGGRAETAVVSTLPNHADLGCQQFLIDHIVLIAPCDHPWADGREVSVKDLLKQPFIMREESAGSHEVLVEALTRHGLDVDQLNVVLTLSNAEAIEMSVEAGIGLAFVSRLAAARGLALGKVVEVPLAGIDLMRDIYIVRHQRHAVSPLQQAFWEFAFSPENESIRRIPDLK
jgi:LysR family transcriptional regulator, low CO2-responsive transcriptional regulator